jgi:hypothetical protein
MGVEVLIIVGIVGIVGTVILLYCWWVDWNSIIW